MPIIPPGSDATEQDWDIFFESQGEPKLRMLMLNGGWPQHLHLRTVEWLARKDRASEALKEASQTEQIDIARSAKDAAWAAAKTAERAAVAAERAAAAAEKANTRASVALAIAAISIAITIAGLLLTHWDTTHAH